MYSTTPQVRTGKLNLGTIQKLYRQGTPISVLTAHDYPSAQAANAAGIDIVLVGDSLAMVACGYQDTTQLSMDEMLYHCRAVKRGAPNSYLIGDLTFGSYEVSEKEAMRNAIRMVQEGGMEAVKLEGGIEMVDTIKKITRNGISVMGHIGLTPQRQSSLGGFKVQGKTAERAEALLQDALAIEAAGCMGMVLEAMPPAVARYITSQLSVPTIGIGAGVDCSGQVLVQLDMLGVFDRFVPKFCKQYEQMGLRATTAISEYNQEVKSRTFPAAQHSYSMDPAELAKWGKTD
ncbi:3-methyl-2-oxobutanoate hydroxymethyltransferase [Taphrina deformans PYCC 5710]|uniref:3-methyl-2-oxobutanoate hydroxymethyltransferase n=1 Tax=Taphrina deformans (strain PYCC 5710 / ATCC 11124 / CBS 356.35 / IMI 108563 / JCM 9778 / NBRC 8474) TaxID=1097556 RepID=R4XB88_TAPDE|nr:3-methyl-2-oxobutanoate hydroxymethyltransferase [Taphrina deformans PYCC 5710]|eukprot:CCG82870.1 3-methyl-2-oxobutanoate hydroxymethyltransferase [Taphrina deformans PYCC 5710]